MRRIQLFLAFLYLLLLVNLVQAQNISVKSFKSLPMDMSASSLDGKRTDQNGAVAALIKIVTPETGFAFDGGTLGIVDTKQMVGEIWVWVPYGSRKITISHQQLGVLREYRYPIDILSERTYEMVLSTAKIETLIKEEVKAQYLSFRITPSNATLEVNDELWSLDAEGYASKYVDFGTYTYRVRASDYITDAGRITVDDPDNTKTVIVNLKPNYAEVTIIVDAEAEIWVNNEMKGVRKWTGPLGKGTYKIECKQEGHETTMLSKVITVDMNGETITMPVPIPLYGSLNLESVPNGATIYLDGKEIGKTPKSINEILIGQQVLKMAKNGYNNHTETVTVAKGERKQVKAVLFEAENNRNQEFNNNNEYNPNNKEISKESKNSSFYLGGSLGTRISSNQRTFSISPEIGFMIPNSNWTVFFCVTYDYWEEKNYDLESHGLMLSPYVRYNIFNIERFSIFLDLTSDIALTGYQGYRVGLRPGISWMATRHWTTSFSMGFFGYDKMLYNNGSLIFNFKTAIPRIGLYYNF